MSVHSVVWATVGVTSPAYGSPTLTYAQTHILITSYTPKLTPTLTFAKTVTLTPTYTLALIMMHTLTLTGRVSSNIFLSEFRILK